MDDDTRMTFDMAMASDVGRMRIRNEDEVRIFPEKDLAVLSDGMGGHQAGDVAAKIAVEVTSEQLVADPSITPSSLVDAISTANTEIRTRGAAEPECRGMGATIVVMALQGSEVFYVHVGDSRLYLFENSRLERLTEDHTLAQQYVQRGLISSQQERTWPGRNLLTRGLGIEDELQTEPGRITCCEGQTYLVCSDGLTEPVDDEQIAEILAQTDMSVEETAQSLVDLANTYGGPDNISVVVARVVEG